MSASAGTTAQHVDTIRVLIGRLYDMAAYDDTLAHLYVVVSDEFWEYTYTHKQNAKNAEALSLAVHKVYEAFCILLEEDMQP